MSKKELPPLRIISLVSENVKRLVAVAITPSGDVVEISGENEAGKSSVIDSIWMALGGEAGSPSEPIRKGEAKAMVRLDLGEYVVTKSWARREDGSTAPPKLLVTNAEGHKLQAPQTVINGLLGRFTFDPLAFDRMKPAEKFEVMKRFVPDVDFAAIAKAHDEDYKARADINRDAKALAGQIAGIVIPEGSPTEKVDEAAIVKEIGDVGAFNAEIETRKERRAQARRDADAKVAEAQEHRTRAAALRKEAEEADARAGAAVDAAQAIDKKLDEAPPLDAPKEVAEITARLEDAKRVNAIVDRAATRADIEKRHADLEAQSAALTEAMDKRQADKLKTIAAAKLPVDGLEFGDGVILLKGIPLEQASAAQRLRTSIAIAMAEKPRLRIIRVTDGSLLDRNGMKILAEMAAGGGYQVWVERVSDSGEGGFVIEDGHLKGADSPADADRAEAA